MRTREAWCWAEAGVAVKAKTCSATMNAAKRTVFMRRSPRHSVKEAREELRRSRLDGEYAGVKRLLQNAAAQRAGSQRAGSVSDGSDGSRSAARTAWPSLRLPGRTH